MSDIDSKEAICPWCQKAAGVIRRGPAWDGKKYFSPECDLIICANPACSRILGALIPGDLQKSLKEFLLAEPQAKAR